MLYSGIIHNTSADTYHPIFLGASPRPSDDAVGICRHRSRFHHTEGFGSKEEAMTFMADCDISNEPSGLLWTWDGQETPAVTADLPPL